MAKRFIILTAGLSIAIFLAWTVYPDSKVDMAKWLLGTWEMKTPKGSVYETWVQMDANKLYGKSYKVIKQDTMMLETVTIVQEGDQLVYIPKVANQNEGLPVRFPSKLIAKDEMVFENIKHDFPQLISYKRTGKNSLEASISGMKDGQESKRLFPMTRLNN